METNQNQGGMKKLFISAIIAMLLINGVTLYFLFSEKKEKTEVITQKDTLQQDFKNISDSLDASRDQISLLSGKNAALDKIIAAKQDSLESEKTELAKLFSENKLTVAELDHARRMISQNDQTIAALEKKVEEYERQTHELTQQKDQLTEDLSCEQQTTEQLTEDKAGLTKKVNAGSVLQISKVDVEAIRKKNNGTEVPVTKSKAVESLKISFETGVNKVLDPGKISFYIRIIDPHGETLATNQSGVGYVPTSDSTAKPVLYSKKEDVNWTQSNKKITVYWNRNIKDPGTYRVEVYQSGKMVGRGAVRLS